MGDVNWRVVIESAKRNRPKRNGMSGGGMANRPGVPRDIRAQAQNVADMGRYGDTELIHVNKSELRGLESVLPLTTNPETGHKEAWLPLVMAALGGIWGGLAAPEDQKFLGALRGMIGGVSLGAGVAGFGAAAGAAPVAAAGTGVPLLSAAGPAGGALASSAGIGAAIPGMSAPIFMGAPAAAGGMAGAAGAAGAAALPPLMAAQGPVAGAFGSLAGPQGMLAGVRPEMGMIGNAAQGARAVQGAAPAGVPINPPINPTFGGGAMGTPPPQINPTFGGGVMGTPPPVMGTPPPSQMGGALRPPQPQGVRPLSASRAQAAADWHKSFGPRGPVTGSGTGGGPIRAGQPRSPITASESAMQGDRAKAAADWHRSFERKPTLGETMASKFSEASEAVADKAIATGKNITKRVSDYAKEHPFRTAIGGTMLAASIPITEEPDKKKKKKNKGYGSVLGDKDDEKKRKKERDDWLFRRPAWADRTPRPQSSLGYYDRSEEEDYFPY